MKRDQIENLLSRYINGDTTNEEEEQLRQFFTRTQVVPPEWNPYKELFAWERLQQSAALGNDAESASTTILPIRKYRPLVAAGVAALVLVGIGLTTILLRSGRAEVQRSQDYAVLDGLYTTDADIIAHEAEMALQLVSSSDEDTFDAIDIFATR